MCTNCFRHDDMIHHMHRLKVKGAYQLMKGKKCIGYYLKKVIDPRKYVPKA